jgi:hypothetical protein
MYLVMLTNHKKIWVARPIARQLQLKKKVLFVVAEAAERDDCQEQNVLQEEYGGTGRGL